MRISDLNAGDRVSVKWYPGQVIPAIGTVIQPIRHASRASGTHIRLDNLQIMRLKATMKIDKV